MNEEEKRAIETQLTLQERRLALKERQHNLSVKEWRKWGAFVGGVAVFLLCFFVVGIGGCELTFCGKETKDKAWCWSSYTNSCNGFVTQGTTNIIVALVSNTTNETNNVISKTIPLPDNSLGVIMPNAQTTVALQNALPKKACPCHSLPLAALILKVFLIFAGLGIAAFTVRAIANRNDD